MNKHEISKGIIRQNIYNVRYDGNHYHHLTCYFTAKGKILFVFKAGENIGLVDFTEDKSIKPLELDKKQMSVVREVLKDWAYSHLTPICMYGENYKFQDIFPITNRDKWVLNKLQENKSCTKK